MNFSDEAQPNRNSCARLIDFEENKSRSAIDHRFVTKKNVKAQNAIEATFVASAYE